MILFLNHKTSSIVRRDCTKTRHNKENLPKGLHVLNSLTVLPQIVVFDSVRWRL